MKLGTLLDTAKHRPAVVHRVTFRVAALNGQAQKTHLNASAVLVHVDEDERLTALSEAAAALTTEFKERPVTPRMREEWDTYHFLAVALRDESDPAEPFADGGAAVLRSAMVYSVADALLDQYREFIKREYHPAPPPEDLAAMKADAAGK